MLSNKNSHHRRGKSVLYAHFFVYFLPAVVFGYPLTKTDLQRFYYFLFQPGNNLYRVMDIFFITLSLFWLDIKQVRITMEHGLEVDSVIKKFGEKTVLADVYLHCRPGEIIGLFGRNGTGKSTL